MEPSNVGNRQDYGNFPSTAPGQDRVQDPTGYRNSPDIPQENKVWLCLKKP